jgi:cobalamin biosynthesis protein CbiD
MGSDQAKRTAVVSKATGTPRRPAGMQAINPALYQQIRQAVRELSQSRPTVATVN